MNDLILAAVPVIAAACIGILISAFMWDETPTHKRNR